MTTPSRILPLAFALSTLLALGSNAQAEEDVVQKLPFVGVGPAMGWDFGGIDGHSANGPGLQLRAAMLLNTYPIVAVGLDFKFNRLSVENGAIDTTGDRLSVGPIAGLIVPFDLFGIKLKGAPRGAGMPIYVGVQALDRVSFANDGGTLKGFSLKAGVQFPLPKAAVQVEYTRARFGTNDGVMFMSPDDIDGNTVFVNLQIPIIFLHHD